MRGGDQHHVGAMDCERPPAHRAGNHAGEIEHAHAGERALAVRQRLRRRIADLLDRKDRQVRNRAALIMRIPFGERARHGDDQPSLRGGRLELLRLPAFERMPHRLARIVAAEQLQHAIAMMWEIRMQPHPPAIEPGEPRANVGQRHPRSMSGLRRAPRVCEDPPVAPWPFISLAGLGIGLLMGFFGVGGSSVATPLLSLLGVPGLAAVASPLPATIPSAVSAAIPYLRAGEARPKAATWTLLGAIPATIVGGILSQQIGGPPLLVASGVVLVVVGIRVILPIEDAAREAGARGSPLRADRRELAGGGAPRRAAPRRGRRGGRQPRLPAAGGDPSRRLARRRSRAVTVEFPSTGREG